MFAAAAPQPGSQQDFPEAALAAPGQADALPGDDAWFIPDPDCDPPAELAGLSDAELRELDPRPAGAGAGPAPSAWPLSYPAPFARLRPAPPAWPARPAPGVPNGHAPLAWPADYPAPGALNDLTPLSYPAPGTPDGLVKPPGPAAAGPGPVPEIGPAGFVPRDGSGGGTGFADGGALDVLAPGVALAGFADEAHSRLSRLTDDELIGVMRAWRRQTSWAQARELAVIAELARRRPAEGTPPGQAGQFPGQPSEFVGDEVAFALTLTGRAAGAHLDLAIDLSARPATAAALEAGRIDLPRARIIGSGVVGLAEAHAAAMEAEVLPKAPGMTTGQLRAAVARAVLAADPQAARQQREEAERQARVDCWTDPAGTANLAGRNLPAAQTLAADKRLGRIAAAWKKQGATGGTDLLCARAYLALLLGHNVDAPPADLFPLATDPFASRTPDPYAAVALDSSPHQSSDRDDSGGCVPPGSQMPAGLGRPDASGLGPLAGTVNLTVPLTTLLGLSEAPGEAAGYGPLDPGTARLLACAAAGHSAARWHITVTGPGGLALAHGTRRGPGTGTPGGGGWTVAVTAEPVTAGPCDHRSREPGYRPGAALQRLVRARAVTCAAPGCRRPAVRCDLDHTVAYDEGGLTCECNLAPLCRHHHRVKQAEGWTLRQGSPGVMAWLTPAGRRYVTLPSQHPT